MPHKDKRFPGFMDDGKGPKLDPEIHRKYIFGGHVGEYMEVKRDRWQLWCLAGEQPNRYRHGVGQLQWFVLFLWRGCELKIQKIHIISLYARHRWQRYCYKQQQLAM